MVTAHGVKDNKRPPGELMNENFSCTRELI